jgi:hypothetical protein
VTDLGVDIQPLFCYPIDRDKGDGRYMRILITDEEKMNRGFYELAKGFTQAYPVMLPWEIVSWIEARIGWTLSDIQIMLLEEAWNDLGRKNWDMMMKEKELGDSII